jgi:diguanylate cyclase (GGDEF)-like protein
MIGSSERQINEAMQKVREAITEVVRAEQWRDQLTGLPNDVALTNILQEHINKGQGFWCAFVEVDKFKSINDRFGYSQADNLLKKIAEVMSQLSAAFFGTSELSFRAHGDEFYMLGQHRAEASEETLASQLDNIRSSIRNIRVLVDGRAEPMCCTVSVGWILSSDVSPGAVTAQGVKILLEQTIAVAKREGRDRVVRYSAERVSTSASVSLRADCGACGAKFSLDVAPDQNKTDFSLWCPNCGVDVARPEVAVVPGSSPPMTIEA